MSTPAERVAADPAYRAGLVAARSWGVSPSVFLGRKLRTTYEVDASGRTVAAEVESAWTREDRELAMALHYYEADCCPGCGGALAETTHPDNEEMYDASIQARCHKCTALAIVHGNAQHRPHPGALLIGAHLKTQGEQKDDPSLPAG
jgi:hypothetical protein